MLVVESFDIKKPFYYKMYGELINKWRKDWNIPEMQVEYMPTNGFVVKKDNKYICAAWFYMTECPICLLGHYISTKEIRGELRKEAQKFLINYIEEFAKNLGFKKISTFVRNPNLIFNLEELGYGKEFKEKYQTNFVKNI